MLKIAKKGIYLAAKVTATFAIKGQDAWEFQADLYP
jgi:hypothetical protein